MSGLNVKFFFDQPVKNDVRMECKKNFDQPVKNDKITCENIRKTATGQRDVYTTGC